MAQAQEEVSARTRALTKLDQVCAQARFARAKSLAAACKMEEYVKKAPVKIEEPAEDGRIAASSSAKPCDELPFIGETVGR